MCLVAKQKKKWLELAGRESPAFCQPLLLPNMCQFGFSTPSPVALSVVSNGSRNSRFLFVTVSKSNLIHLRTKCETRAFMFGGDKCLNMCGKGFFPACRCLTWIT
jgi:hypothetical protein